MAKKQPIPVNSALAFNRDQYLAYLDLKFQFEKCQKLGMKIMVDKWTEELTIVNGELIKEFTLPDVEGNEISYYPYIVGEIDEFYNSDYPGLFAEFKVPVTDE